MFKAYNSRIQAENTDSGTVVTLKTDTLEVVAEPYLANGSTAQENYDGQHYFQEATFRIRVTLSYNFEMTSEDGYQSASVGGLHDLLNIFFTNDASNRTVDLRVNYDEASGSFLTPANAYDSNAINQYLVPDVIPNITEETAQWVFESRSRKKERELELITSDRNYTYTDVRWIFE